MGLQKPVGDVVVITIDRCQFSLAEASETNNSAVKSYELLVNQLRTSLGPCGVILSMKAS